VLEVIDITRTLKMKFDSDLGKAVTINLSRCKEGVLASEVRTMMADMISTPVFTYGLTGALGAKVAENKVTTLF
jgi:hypothetical protein